MGLSLHQYPPAPVAQTDLRRRGAAGLFGSLASHSQPSQPAPSIQQTQPAQSIQQAQPAQPI